MHRMAYVVSIVFLIVSMIIMSGCGDEEQTTVTEAKPPTTVESPDKTATYTVTFDAAWSLETHPKDFPPDPHFSGLIGAVHNEHVTFWQEGLPASPGIKNMAETGSKDPLNMEIGDAVDKGTAFTKLSGDGIDPSPGSVSLTFQVDEQYPFISLVSMIAPSPDWFVGVDTLSLWEDGTWVDTKVVELYAYDAGTDSGVTYGAPDSVTGPPEPIAVINEGVLTDNGTMAPLGTFTFKRTA